MGIYMFNWKYLKRHLLEDAANPESSHDFGKDVIPQMLNENNPLFVYNFNGYWKDVGTVKSLWDAHMDLLYNEEDWSLQKKTGQCLLATGAPSQVLTKLDIRRLNMWHP